MEGPEGRTLLVAQRCFGLRPRLGERLALVAHSGQGEAFCVPWTVMARGLF